jgi:site-specific DNA-cytosine methylase
LQVKFIELAKPGMVLIENVPPRTWGDNPTQEMYDELAVKVRALGYSYTHEDEVNCAEHGANTSRRRYFGVGVKGDVPFVFPAKRTKYSGFRDLLDPAHSVRHNYRCRLSAVESWTPVRLSGPYTSPFMSKQIGKVRPETDKEQQLAERMGMMNPKGFRIYSSKSPAPTICAHGSEKYCGPGGHTQFITDKAGIRILRLVEAARVTGMIPCIVDQLSMVKESLAFHIVGNSVPVETMGAILGRMVEMWLEHCIQRAAIEVSETARVVKAESSEKWIDVGLKDARAKQAWYPGAALEASAANKGKKGKLGVASKAAPEDKLWYPAVEDLVRVQRRDPECMAILQQLELLKKGGIPALKLAGVSKERMRYLQLHEVDAEGQLRCAEVIVHVYGSDGKLPAEKGMGQAQWEMDKIVNESQTEEGSDQEQWACDFDRSASRVVVPKELRDGIYCSYITTRVWPHMPRGWTWLIVCKRQVIHGRVLAIAASKRQSGALIA